MSGFELSHLSVKKNLMKFVLFFLISFNLYSAGPASDFHSLCKATLQDKPSSLPLCETINQKFFINNKSKDISAVKPSDVNAPASPLDSKIQFFIFNDPNYLAGVAYCYFVYRNWISPSEVSPDTLATSASGFSILNEDLKLYQNWISSKPEGQKCKARVEKEAEVSLANLEVLLKDKVALIGLNPYAAIQTDNPSAVSVMDEMKLTVNHERIHAYQVACPDFEKWSMKEWEKLPFAKKNEYIKKYPSYTWSISKVAGREYVAFLYEGEPSKITEHVKKCKLN